jgi:hypothetical protein
MEPPLTPNLEDSERISHSMRVLPYEEARKGVLHFIEEPLQERGGLTEWDLSFLEYVEEHKNSTLLFCRYGKHVGIVFSPADHHGIWVRVSEGTHSKGIVPDHLVTFLEGLAKSKGLV